MRAFLAEYGRFIATATYQGRLFLVEWYPALVPSGDDTDKVIGDLISVPERGDFWEKLDDYEECGPQFSQPNEYVRTRVTVSIGRVARRQAWVYLYNRSTLGLQRIESGDFCCDTM